MTDKYHIEWIITNKNLDTINNKQCYKLFGYFAKYAFCSYANKYLSQKYCQHLKNIFLTVSMHSYIVHVDTT